jgi:hypothetical protein
MVLRYQSTRWTMNPASIWPLARNKYLGIACGLVLLSSPLLAWAGDLDTIGVTLLRLTDPTLTGTGVRAAQAEAGSPTWEVNPAAVNQPTSFFTYFSSAGSTNDFPNFLGSESDHADQVGNAFYGIGNGVATNLAHLDNYEVGYFYDGIIRPGLAINAKVVNQSFIFDGSTVAEQQVIDSAYDNYVSQFNTLFISGAGNGGDVSPPATAYNGLAVAAYGGSSSVGPTPDNGRSKPDITAPASFTSFSTPLVAGAAALLAQAGARGDGGSGTTLNSTNARTIKALLLNGAIKPADWTHSSTAPLDTRYGAGILNVFNSYRQLAGGKHAFIEATSVSTGDPHPPAGATGNISALVGWDLNSCNSTANNDGVNHYYFNLSNSLGKSFTLTTTLVWQRHLHESPINNLDLFLFNTSNSNLISSSVSTVDNVEHLFLTTLPPGRYDLQVFKHGGMNRVSNTETYALAFEIFSLALRIAHSDQQVVISWPFSPTGFRLETTSTLGFPTSWNTVTEPPAVSNGSNMVTLPALDSFQFFRLQRP